MEQKLVDIIAFEQTPYALFVIVVSWLTIKVGVGGLEALGERFTGRRLLLKQVAALGRFAVIVVATVAVVSSLVDLHEKTLMAVSGSVAVAVGFGFKDLLASIVAGVILLFDRPFHVGDRITFGDYYGEVQEIGLRTVRFSTLDDNLVSVPNHLFLSDRKQPRFS